MKLKHRNRGISLLEVAIAFAITCALVAATLPNFQDYTIRARVNEALEQASGTQGELVQICMQDNDAIIDFSGDTPYQYTPKIPERDFVGRVEVTANCALKDLVVTVWTYNTGAEADPVIEWTAKVPNSVTTDGFEAPYFWNCRIIRGEFAHVPPECRRHHRKS
jgi:type IV pilus assembly protein PilA